MKNNNFSRFIYTIVHGLLAIFTAISLGGILYIYCNIACFINPKKVIYKEFAFLCKSLLWVLGTGYKTIGQIPDNNENYIVVCDHKNWMDALFISAFFNGVPGVVLLDEKMFKYPILGYFLKKVNAIAINKKGKKGWKIQKEKYDAFVESAQVLNKGIHLFLFPEGTRSPDGELSKFKKGAAKLAILTGKKILTLGLAGAYEFSNKKSWLFTQGKIVLCTGELITYTGSDEKELTGIIKSAVENCIQRAKEAREDSFRFYGPIL